MDITHSPQKRLLRKVVLGPLFTDRVAETGGGNPIFLMSQGNHGCNWDIGTPDWLPPAKPSHACTLVCFTNTLFTDSHGPSPYKKHIFYVPPK